MSNRKKPSKKEMMKRKRTKKGHWTIEQAQNLRKLATLLLEDEAFRERFEENTHEVFDEIGIRDLPVEFVPLKFKVPIGRLKARLHPTRRSVTHTDHSEYTDHCDQYWEHDDHSEHGDAW